MQMLKIDALTGLRAALVAEPERRWTVYNAEVLEPLRPIWEPMLAMMPGAGGEETPEQKASRLFKLYGPDQDTEQGLRLVTLLERSASWPAVCQAVEEAVKILAPEAHGVALPPVLTTLVLSSERMERMGGYSGSGRPGHVMVHVWPTEDNIPRLPAAAAHELHHNVRLSVEPWTVGTSVGQYLVLEGLAEAFAAEMFGEERIGPWSRALGAGTLAAVNRRYAEALEITGFNKIRAYIFGDWAAAESGYEAVGVPDFAGYSVGYALVRQFCSATGISAAEAAYIPWREIVNRSGYFN